MEDKKQTDIDKELGHYVPECLNPFNEIDAKKILKERYKQNLEDSEPREFEDVTVKTVTVDTAEPIPLLEDISYTEPDPMCNIQELSDKEHFRSIRNSYIRLQSLYLYEYRYLFYKYQLKKREYLRNKKSDRDSYGPVKCSKWDNKEEYEKYHEYKLLNCYHKTTGQEAVLFKNAMERKKKATLLLKQKRILRSPRCKFSEMGVRCTGFLIPGSKFCFKHILSDTNQCLFRACSTVQSNNICHEPIVNFDSSSTCVLHEKIPMLRD